MAKIAKPPMAGHRSQRVQIDGTATVSGAVSATNLDIRDLASAQDSVTAVATNLDIRDLTNASDSVAVYGYNGSANAQPRVDSSTNALDVIDYAHHEIHAGSAFTCHFNNDVTNIGEMTGIAFNTPNTTKWVHIFAEAHSTGAAYFAIYEDADLDVDEGTDLTIFNMNRNSATASTVTTVETSPEAGKATSYTEAQLSGATLSTATEILRKYLGTSGKQSYGGDANHDSEFILKQNTQYCFVLYSLTADDVTHNITLTWYEHTAIA